MATIATNVATVLKLCNSLVTANNALTAKLAVLENDILAIKAELDTVKATTDILQKDLETHAVAFRIRIS